MRFFNYLQNNLIANYRGRFAPSPTGELHFGSLIALLGSYLTAKKNQGVWLIRIEDIDSTRCKKIYSEKILKLISAYGLVSDEKIRIQSEHLDDYEQALKLLEKQLYYCHCNRKERNFCLCSKKNYSEGVLRLRLENQEINFNDELLGFKSYELKNYPDPILKRKNGDFAYLLASLVDDEIQGISDVVRGSDLLELTPLQIFIQKKLRIKTPNYLHLPLALDEKGRKLSKQNHATALKIENASLDFLKALEFLGFTITEKDLKRNPQELLKEVLKL